MQNTELQALGILLQTKVPTELDWMSDGEKRFMLTLLAAGEEGVHKRLVQKEEKQNEFLSLRLSAHGLAKWERDNNGREMFFTLTWKGEDAGQLLLTIARNASRRPAQEKEREVGRG